MLGYDAPRGVSRHPTPTAAAAAAAAPKPSVSWDDAYRGVAQQQAAAIGQRSTPLPPARSIRDDLKTQASGGAGGTPSLPPAPGGGGGRGGGILSKFRPRIGRTVGLMGLGAAGAAAYGMHRSNADDRERNSLIYAPMQGSMMQ